MAERLPHYRTGRADLDQRLDELLDAAGAGANPNRDQLFEILAAATRLAGADVDRLSLKITNAALRELARAFRIFAPYRGVPKVTMFGSARTLADDPLYSQARDMARVLAATGWMVVTGGGPGIMAAGLEGAGRQHSFGINIRLPFEQGANEFIAGDAKLVTMKYFFTRKLMLLKESDAFVVLPGGFGTLDEALELLTLMQTGKADPSPIVLLEVPGGTYWHAWERFVTEEVITRGLASPEDRSLYRIADDVTDAVAEILGFYRNYRSRRAVGEQFVIRLRNAPTEPEIAALSEEFADICTDGCITASAPLPAEVADDDQLDLPRIVLCFDRMSHGRLRDLIDRLNTLPSAPPPAALPTVGTPR
ncbi:MAG TPA: TIGR00730 family Rossman fold protein [Acidimicrobiales bacterium]|nr:TIGR00730 family Rossman fold protein [Acidimicrobiales bacterium]